MSTPKRATLSKVSVEPEIVLPKSSPGLYLVVWEDAKVVTEGAAWHSIVELSYSPYLIYQVGFLVKDVPEGIMLSEAWSDGLMGNPTQIPRGMVRAMKRLG